MEDKEQINEKGGDLEGRKSGTEGDQMGSITEAMKHITFKVWPDLHGADLDTNLRDEILKLAIAGSTVEVETVEGSTRHGKITGVRGRQIRLAGKRIAVPIDLVLNNEGGDAMALTTIVRIELWDPATRRAIR